jgi:acyl-CoA thioesterase-1
MNQNNWLTLISKKILVLGLFCLLIPLSTAAQTTAPTILVMGDSLSAEYGLQRGSGWVSLLQNRLRQQGSSWEVINASISGETTAGGLTRMAPLLQQKKPKIVLLELGANDALRGLSVKESEKNLRAMINLSKESGAKVLLFGMQIPPNYGQDYTKQFKDIYPMLASSEKIQLLPFFMSVVATNKDLFQAENIHPNEKAQAVLFKNVWGAMAPYQTLLLGK